jgi:hypothetical protein
MAENVGIPCVFVSKGNFQVSNRNFDEIGRLKSQVDTVRKGPYLFTIYAIGHDTGEPQFSCELTAFMVNSGRPVVATHQDRRGVSVVTAFDVMTGYFLDETELRHQMQIWKNSL